MENAADKLQYAVLAADVYQRAQVYISSLGWNPVPGLKLFLGARQSI